MPRGQYDRTRFKKPKPAPERVIPSAEQLAAAAGLELRATCTDCRYFEPDGSNPGWCNRYPQKVSRYGYANACGEFRES